MRDKISLFIFISTKWGFDSIIASITSDGINILIILSLPIHEYWICHHLFMFSSVSSDNILFLLWIDDIVSVSGQLDSSGKSKPQWKNFPENRFTCWYVSESFYLLLMEEDLDHWVIPPWSGSPCARCIIMLVEHEPGRASH